MKKALVFVAGSFKQDAGTEYMMFELISHLEEKYILELFAPHTAGNYYEQSIASCNLVKKMSSTRASYWKQACLLWFEIIMKKPEKFIVFNYQLGMSAGLALSWLPKFMKPKAVLIHHLPIAWIDDDKEKERIINNFPVFDLHIVPSTGLAIGLSGVVPALDKESIKVVPNGIDIQQIKCLSEQGEGVLKKEKCWWGCAYVGALRPDKRVDRLLRCFSTLPERENVQLTIVGDGVSRKELEKLTIELGVGHLCVFVGHQQNPYTYIRQSDLLVQASDWETFGLSLLEAMSLGVPVLAMGDHSEGLKDVLQNNIQGRLIESGSEEEFTYHWSQLLHDADTRKSMAIAATKQAKLFSKEQMLLKYDGYID